MTKDEVIHETICDLHMILHSEYLKRDKKIDLIIRLCCERLANAEDAPTVPQQPQGEICPHWDTGLQCAACASWVCDKEKPCILFRKLSPVR